MIHGQKWSLPLLDPTSLTIYFDWSQVVYFDDSALLELLLVQQSILGHGVSATHFAGSRSEVQRGRPGSSDFTCQEPVLRQLGATGYIRHWLSGAFGAGAEEVYRLSAVNPLRRLPPLTRHDDILPITSCRTSHALAPGSPEDGTLRRYEEDAAIYIFARQNRPEMRQRHLIANGEFGQLIIRQCRKNTIEHASPFTSALSIARVVRKCDLEADWSIRFKDLQTYMPGPLIRLLSGVPEDCPVLDMTVIDNGCGIPHTIEATWGQHALQRSDPWQRVDHLAGPDWPRDAKLIEFALDKRVSRKPHELRSLEDSGLGRIGELATRDGGVLAVTCANYRVVHEPNAKPAWFQVDRAVDRGTVIRIVLPLTEVPLYGRPKRASLASARALTGAPLAEFNRLPRPWLLIGLRELWETCTKVTPHASKEPHQAEPTVHQEQGNSESLVNLVRPSSMAETDALVSQVREVMDDPPPGVSVAVLDWAELPWGEHEASRFLEKTRSAILSEAGLSPPIVHINVPKELLLLSENAVVSYTDPPQVPVCVFLEGGDKWYWLGLPTPGLGWWSSVHQTADRSARSARATTFLWKVFDQILTARKSISVPSAAWEGSRDLALRYVKKTGLFEEDKIRDTSTGESVYSGRFHSRLNYDTLRGIVASTFISALRSGLESDVCRFLPKLGAKRRKRAKASPPLIGLPNGLAVDRFYRCDGLLGYSPESRSGMDADTAGGAERFRETLVTHLVPDHN